MRPRHASSRTAAGTFLPRASRRKTAAVNPGDPGSEILLHTIQNPVHGLG